MGGSEGRVRIATSVGRVKLALQGTEAALVLESSAADTAPHDLQRRSLWDSSQGSPSDKDDPVAIDNICLYGGHIRGLAAVCDLQHVCTRQSYSLS